MSAPQSDEDLNRDLKSLASVTPRDAGPPAHLDDAIRAAARRAVQSKPGGSGISWRSRSSTPLAAAAVLVLTVSIGFLSLEKPEVHDLQAPQFKEAAVAQAPLEMKAAAPAATVIAAAPVEAAPKQSVAKPTAAPAAKIVAQAPLRAEAQRVAPVAPPPIMEAVPAPVAAAPAPPAPPAPVSAARPQATNEIVLAPKDDARLAGLAKRERYIAPAAPAEPAATAASAPSADAVAEPRAAARVVASMAPAAPPVALKSSPPAALMQDAEVMPQIWIVRIQVLKATGKLKEAEEELAKFRKRHPDYPLPEDLKEKK